ncbi:MAG: hypothetical protein FWG13_00875 [Leptospirales bacterium]|nr:hypothetical protein [Leptospirales bacterium]
MNRKIKKFIIPIAALFGLNCFFLWRIFLTGGFSGEFKGYALGTILAALFALSWILVAGKLTEAAPLEMFKIIGIAFAVKLALLCAVLYLGWNIPFFFLYLGAAFAIGAIGSFALGMLLFRKNSPF